MKVWIRNLTKGIDYPIELPMDERELDKILNPNDEYIIIDSEILDVDEYASIDEVNKLLLMCEENRIDEETLGVMSTAFLYNEIKEMIMKEELPIIINFDEETSDWNMYGGEIWNGADKGMCLFDGGYYNPFNFEVTEDIYDWIDWESVWDNANTDGWHTVKVNDTHYLVHR